MFVTGNLVRMITEQGDAEVMRVLENSDPDAGVTHIAIGNDDSDDYISTDDLELVAPFAQEQPVNHIEPNVPDRTEQEIHEDIQKMFIQIIQWMRSNDHDDRIELKIEATHYCGKDDVDVEFTTGSGYGNNSITTGNLFESARIHVRRTRENELLKPLSIPLYREATE